MAGFRSLAELLRPAPPPDAPVAPQITSEPPAAVTTPAAAALERFCTEVGLARLAAAEAYERAVRRVLTAFVRDVLVRERALGEVDAEALVRRAVAAFISEEPVAVVVAPAVARRLTCEVPVRADPSLDESDLVLEVRDGTLDLRFDVRVRGAVDSALE